MCSYCYFIAALWGNTTASSHFVALARRLVERGHRVVYLPHGQQVNIREGNLQVINFPSPRPTRLRDFIFLQKLVRKHQPDCMIANFGAVNIMTITGWLNRVPCRVSWYRTPSQATVDIFPGLKSKLLRLRKQMIFRRTSHIVANSSSTREDVMVTYHVPSAKVKLFYNTLKDPDTPAQRKAENRIVCVGRLAPWKGQDVLLRALALLNDDFDHMRVELIGEGQLEGEYRQLVADLGLTERVTFRGAVPNDEVLRSMAASAVTVVPSRSEAFGLVNIESFAVKTPVIASAVGGIPEIIRDGVDGFLVPPDDPKALAEKLRRLLSDRALCEQMGENARQRFLEKFEQTNNVEQQVRWFEELTRQHRREASSG